MFDSADIEQLDRIRQIRQSLETGIGDKERLQAGGQFRQLLELLAFSNAQRRESGRKPADSSQVDAAIEAELLETFRQAVHLDHTGVIQIDLLDARRQFRQTFEGGAVVEHQALQAFGKALRQLGQGDSAVQIDDLDAVGQGDADVVEVAAASHGQGFHGCRNRRQPRQPALLVEAESVGLHRQMMRKCLVGFQIFCPRPYVYWEVDEVENFSVNTHRRKATCTAGCACLKSNRSLKVFPVVPGLPVCVLNENCFEPSYLCDTSATQKASKYTYGNDFSQYLSIWPSTYSSITKPESVYCTTLSG